MVQSLLQYATEIGLAASFVAILSFIFGITRFLLKRKVPTSPPSTYPFDVLTQPTELAETLWPTTKSSPLADYQIPYIDRQREIIDHAFSSTGRVLLKGRTKTGKTREAFEVAQRHWLPETTILRLKPGHMLPHSLPLPHLGDLPYKNLILFIDDLDHFCRAAQLLQGSGHAHSTEFPAQLEHTMTYLEHLTGSPTQVKVIATARSETPFWEQLGFKSDVTPWHTFEVVDVPPLGDGETEAVVRSLANATGIAVDAETTRQLANKNEGTFLTLFWAFQQWKQSGRIAITADDVDDYVGRLSDVLESRYQRAVAQMPTTKFIYAALDLMRQCGLELRERTLLAIASLLYSGIRSRLNEAVNIVLVIALFALTSIIKVTSRTPGTRTLGRLFYRYTDRDYLKDFILLPVVPRSLERSLHFLLKDEIPARNGILAPYDGQVEGRGLQIGLQLPGAPLDNLISTLHNSPRGTGVLTAIFSRALELGNQPLARKIAESLRDHDNNFATPLLISMLLRHEGDTKGAREALTQPGGLLRLTIRDTISHELGHIHEAEGHLEDAITEFTRAIELTPDPAHFICRGKVLMRTGQLDAALADLTDALERNPRNATALRFRAQVLEKMQRQPEAQRDFDRAIELQPSDPNALADRAGFYQRCGQLDLAIGDLDLALELKATPYLFHQRALLHGKLAPDRALSDFGKALEMASDEAIIYISRGILLEQLEKYDEAEADLTRALQLAPTDVGFVLIRAEFYRRLNRLDSAVAELARALGLSKTAGIYFRRAQIFREQGELERALEDLEHATELQPSDAEMYLFRGVTLRDLGRSREALQAIDKAVVLAPVGDAPALLHFRGHLHETVGDFGSAVEDFAGAMANDTTGRYRRCHDAALQRLKAAGDQGM